MIDATRLEAFADLPGAPPDVRVRAIRGEERISEPFWYEVDVVSDAIDLDAARGKVASIELRSPLGHSRFVTGAVERIEVAATDEDRATYRLLLVPEVALLRHRRGFRIFQDSTTREVVTAVVTGAGLPADALRWQLHGTYRPRTYCVQYDESEWDFICRLLEDEGIWFAFEHEADAATMVLGDASDAAPLLEPGALVARQGAGLVHTGEPGVWDWEARAALAETSVTVHDFDFERPSSDLRATREVEGPLPREWYESPGGYTDPGEGARRAAARLELLRSGARTAVARSDAISLAPGRRFELVEHPHFEGRHFLTRVAVHLRLHEQSRVGPLEDPGPELAEIELECVPEAQRFRPPRRQPRPRVRGVQTARVTGPAGQEIHTDQHGRVKVQFHWDREGQLDERTSCWIRTAQPHTTGSIMIPRIGWEVLVQFLDGDPDRPIVLGHFFNPIHQPDYALPDRKTVTGHRSNASPGAGGANEVSFDDAAGSQRVVISTPHDITIAAANDKTSQVGKNRGETVGGSRTVSVGGDESTAISGNEADGVGKSRTETIGANRTVNVNASASEEVTGAIAMTIGGSEQIKVGNPLQGVLEVIAANAVEAAAGAAGGAAQRASGALMGPIMPALSAARSALGPALEFAGPASAILGGGGPGAIFGAAAGALGGAPGAAQAGQMAAGIAAGVASGALAKAGVAAAAGAGGGGAGGGGSGTWATTVTADLTETVGALAALSTASGVMVGVGGSSTETIGAARIELIRGGKAENVTAMKTELVGTYFVKAAQGISVDAKAAISVTVASQTQKIAKGHAISADGAVAITASTLDLEASGKISLICGPAKVVIDSSGINVTGPTGVTVEATGEIEMKAPAIMPGG